MPGLGQKLSSQSKGLGVKSKSMAYSLGNKSFVVPHQVSNIITPNKVGLQITGTGVSNLIPNNSNSADIQYMPTGMRNSLEKRSKK
jgi:hypothetical protein